MLRHFAVAVTSCLILASAAAAQGIAWQPLDAAQQLASQSQKLVLIHFYGDNCAPCQRLEANVFPQSAVQQAIAGGYIPVKINGSRQVDVARAYHISSWPTDVIVDATGRELFRTTSPQDANQYTYMLSAVQARYRGTLPSNPEIENVQQSMVNSAQRAQQQTTLAAQQTAGYMTNQASQYTQAANDQLKSTQDYAASIAQRYQQSVQNAQEQVNQYAQQTQQAVQPYAEPYSQAYEQATGQNPLDAARQTAEQYAQNVAAQAQSQLGALAAPANPANPTVQPYGQDPSVGQTTTPPPVNTQVATSPNGAMISNPYMQPQQAAPTAEPTISNPPVATSYESLYANQAPTNPAAPTSPAPATTAPTAPTAPAMTAPPTGPIAGAPTAGATAPPMNTMPPEQVAASIPPAPAYQPKPPAKGLEGFCPVTLADHKQWAQGDKRYGAIHLSRTYLFTSKEAQAKFLADPDRYAPVLSGFDPVEFHRGNRVEGNRKHGLTVNGRVFLFVSEASLEEFSKSQNTYLATVRQAMQPAPMRR